MAEHHSIHLECLETDGAQGNRAESGALMSTVTVASETIRHLWRFGMGELNDY